MLRVILVALMFCTQLASANNIEEIKFKRRTLTIGSKTLSVEVASTPKEHTRGLMYRSDLKENEGMLFEFSSFRRQSFWMKNTFIDLDLGFFDKDRKLVEIAQLNGVKSELEMNPPRYQSRKPAQFVLEVNQGWFKRNKIKLGAQFTVSKPEKP